MTIESLDSIKPMNNTLLIREISKTISEFSKPESRLIVIRNEANQKRERTVAEIAKLPEDPLYIISGSNKVFLDLSLGDTVLVDTNALLQEISVKDNDSKFYLLRGPDVICKLINEGEEIKDEC